MRAKLVQFQAMQTGDYLSVFALDDNGVLWVGELPGVAHETGRYDMMTWRPMTAPSMSPAELRLVKKQSMGDSPTD